MPMVQWILLGLTLRVLRINGYSVNVTRGYQDFIYPNIQQTSTGDLICDDNTTYIFDSDSLRGKCVRDYEIIKNRSKGKFLPRGSKCVGVRKDEKVVNLTCSEDDLSVRWIWTVDAQMLNLKTLRCLQVERRTKRGKTIREFSMEQCNMSDKQKWVCTARQNRVKNKEVRGSSFRWIVPGNAAYFENCFQTIYSYKGCYRFSDGNFMKLIGTTGCDTRHNGTCGLEIEMQAPISTGYTSCQLDWTSSVFTISGFNWRPFTEAIAGVQLNTTHYPVTLQINDRSAFLSKWKGHLLKLNIQCSNDVGRSERHCALLKIKGTATDEIPIGDNPAQTLNPPSTASTPTTPTTSHITSSSTPSPTSEYQNNMTSTTISSQKLSSTGTSDPEKNSQDGKDKEDSSIILPIIISSAVLFCLLLVAVVIVIVCKRRKKKVNDVNQNEEHIYEEAHPVENGPVSPIYIDIDNLRKSKSKKSNSSRKRNDSQTYQEPTENPFYHTLERTADRVEDNGIYEELDEIAKPPTPKAFEKELDV